MLVSARGRLLTNADGDFSECRHETWVRNLLSKLISDCWEGCTSHQRDSFYFWLREYHNRDFCKQVYTDTRKLRVHCTNVAPLRVLSVCACPHHVFAQAMALNSQDYVFSSVLIGWRQVSSGSKCLRRGKGSSSTECIFSTWSTKSDDRPGETWAEDVFPRALKLLIPRVISNSLGP